MPLHTIEVVYIQPDKRVSGRYAFNTPDEFRIGDLLDSPRYGSYMRVQAVYEKTYYFANSKTGQLSTEKLDNDFRPIKTLRLNPYPYDILVTKVNTRRS